MLNLHLSDLNISINPSNQRTLTYNNGLPAPAHTKPEDRPMEKLRNYAHSLPYSVEPNSEMQDFLDFIVGRLIQSVEAKDYDVGLLQWDTMLT